MNRLSFAALLCALPAAAIPPLPDGDAERPGGAFPCDPGEFGGFPQGQDDVFSPVHLVSPSWGQNGVPLNPELVLGGFISDLEAQPPFMRVALLDPLDNEVPISRSGRFVRPLVELEPNTSYRLGTLPSEGCPDCFFGDETPFTTGFSRDELRPTLAAEPTAQVFVMPQEEQQCGMGQALVAGRITGLGFDVARVSVAVTPPGGVTVRAFDRVVSSSDEISFTAQLDSAVALGDRVRVAVTPVDLAGHAGPARAVRVRARSFDDARVTPFDELDARQCSLPDGASVALPDELPVNARLRVDFPVEPVPLALAGDAGVFPLLPEEHVGTAQVVAPIGDLPAGADLELVALPCPHCKCPGCNVVARGRVRTAAGPDTTPPSPPEVVAVREDLDPPRAEDVCYPDRTALVVILAPGVDDATPPELLRYDVTLRLDGQLAIDAGRALPATLLPDGNVAVRLATTAYGRLLPKAFDLTVAASDLGGNRTLAEHRHDPLALGGGCAAAGGAAPPLWLAGLLLLAGARRRRR